MKKLISAVLAASVAISMLVFGTTTASAAKKNYCKDFEALSWFLLISEGKTEFAPALAVEWTIFNYKDDDAFLGSWDETSGTVTADDNGNCMAYPADKLNRLAEKLMKLNGSLSDLIKNNPDKDSAYRYDEKNGLIAELGGGKGSSYMYLVCGYTENGDGTYNVYYQGTEQDTSRYATLEELAKDKDKVEALVYLEDEEYVAYTYDEVIKNKTNKDFLDNLICIMYKDYKKVVTSVGNDGIVKIISFGKADKVPAQDEMITPIIGVEYNTGDSITVDGDQAFPADTVITAEIIKDGETVDTVKTALKDVIKKDGRMLIFDITAMHHNEQIQPNDGKVKVTIDVPEDFSLEGLKLFYVSHDGEKEELEITVDKANRKVITELEHFSVYVLYGEYAPPKNGDDGSVTAVAVMAALSAAAIAVLTLIEKKMSRA